jgi:hypothetical protein
MATRDELLDLAHDCRIPIVTIDALIEYRLAHDARAQAPTVDVCEKLSV